MSMQKEKTFVLNSLIAWFMIVKYLNYWENILLCNNLFHSRCMREWFDQLISIFSFLSDLWAPVLCFPALQPQQWAGPTLTSKIHRIGDWQVDGKFSIITIAFIF